MLVKKCWGLVIILPTFVAPLAAQKWELPEPKRIFSLSIGN